MKYTDLVKYIKSVTKQEQVDFIVSKDIIEIVEDSFKNLKRDLKRWELSRFLYYVCHQLNRFSIPTNYYHYDDDIDYFERYLKLFEKIEKDFLDNILTFSPLALSIGDRVEIKNTNCLIEILEVQN